MSRWPDRRAGKRGLRGKRGAEEVKSAESAVSREEKRDATAVSRWPFLVLTVTFIYRERSSPGRFAKISFGSGSLGPGAESGEFENQSPAVVQLDFLGFPCLSLVEPIWVRIGWTPRTVEPVEVGFVIRHPFFAKATNGRPIFAKATNVCPS